MSAPRRERYVHLMVHHDGAPESRTWRLRIGAYRALIALAAASVLAIIVTLVLIGPIARAAARVPGLERHIRNLEAENARIVDLAAALDSVQLGYERVRGMIGGDIVPDMAQVAGGDLPVAPPVAARGPAAPAYGSGPTIPSEWPLADAGFITQGLVDQGGRDEPHPGIDIAVAMQTPVRAAGGGTVAATGEDAEYGKFVLMEHPSGYQTMYGHLSRAVVARGDRLGPREVLGLSGNSGRSTAPHLHFEIRREGRSLDPLTLVKETR
ncbi:MAG TPA: M23 family metallopeptidase [Gemmatimonadales bacterium]|nr:M23 family metallopeptidase [Gemmatimonadales bacterium]